MMRALIVFESMYGNTHAVADAIAEGLRPLVDVEVVPVGRVTAEQVAAAELLVVGGPTHVHGMTSSTSRKGAVEAVAKSSGELSLDRDVGDVGLREWFDGLTSVTGTPALAFDSRYDGPLLFTGHASKGIAKRLRDHGYQVRGEPTSFLVDKANHLLPGELERAVTWARTSPAFTI
jgi:hypothetical protein